MSAFASIHAQQLEVTTRSCWPGEPGTDPRLCPPNEAGYRDSWEFWSVIPESIDQERMHPAERSLGAIGMSLDRAWQYTIGRDDVVIAVLDSGIRWEDRDLIHKIYVNPGEVPPPAGASSHDANGDGVFDVRDYALDERVGDRNGNGVLDAGDLILAFSDCKDDDGNGYVDDISGYDFFAGEHCGFDSGDNDPFDATDFGHGTGIGSTAAAETNDGYGDVGVCPRCRVLPVRVGDSFVVDGNRFARGLTYAVHAGATVVASALGSYNNTPAARAALDFAYESGVAVIASAADEFAYHHNYPSVYNHALYVNAIRFNHADDWREASTFWGVNPCTNFGARVWITVPAESCSSGATSRLAGVAGLVASAARDAGFDDLLAEEVYQILRASADDLDNTKPDWGEMRYPARPGFDQLYGYGRLNALRAVQMVREGLIPPSVDLAGPVWFSIVSPRRQRFLPVSATIRARDERGARYRLEYALGVEPAEDDYVEIAAGTIGSRYAGPVGLLDFHELPLPAGPAPRNREERDRYSVTLRLRVVDHRGLVGEARRSFFVFDDPTWKKHFPVSLGASGEAGPLVVDLDQDGRDEIVLPTADGRVRILRWSSAGLTTVHALLDPVAPTGPNGVAVRETVLRTAAAGDLNGDGRPSVVVASKDGKVYVFDGDGRRVEGFPVAIDPERARESGPQQIVEHGLLARPVLADLDGRPGLEILIASLDGHLYVWRHDGKALDGFPVALSIAGEQPARLAKIVSTPAVGDVDGDGEVEIVVGSNRVREGLAGIWAVRARGNAHPDGPFLTGWQPFPADGVRPDLLPTVARGVQMDPVLADVDGDGADEVVVYAVTGNSIMLVDQPVSAPPRVLAEYALTPGAASTFRDTSFLAGTGSPSLIDTDGDGTLELYAPLLPMRMITLRFKPGIPIDVPTGLGGWPLLASTEATARIPMLPTFPRRMEDLMLMVRPTAADVDGDGRPEVLVGSGGYLLHAFRGEGGEPPGFPKFTGGWLFSDAAVGDLEGDGRPELVSVTREGYLFVWELEAPAAAGPDR